MCGLLIELVAQKCRDDECAQVNLRTRVMSTTVKMTYTSTSTSGRIVVSGITTLLVLLSPVWIDPGGSLAMVLDKGP